MIPPRNDLAKGFHHMSNHVTMINHDLRFWYTQLHRWAKRGTPIHTHRLHGIGMIESLQEVLNLFQLSTLTDFQHCAVHQIAYNGIVARPFSPGKFITTEKAGGGELCGLGDGSPF